MNKETRIRTALRIVVSIYSGLCVWQVAISELGDMLGTKWLAIICAILIVLFGLAVDVLTTYFNNDYTPEGCEGTGWTRQQKLINKGVCVDIPAEAMEGVGILPDGDEDGDD